MKKKEILDVHDKRYSILENRKCARQRARKGYCERDIYSINAWFLDIIPEMLKDLSKTRKNYPSNLLAEFYEKDKDQIIGTKEEFVFGPHNKNKDVFEEAVAWSEKRWDEILNRMAFLFSECRNMEDDDEQRNKYLKEGFELFVKYFDDLWW